MAWSVAGLFLIAGVGTGAALLLDMIIRLKIEGLMLHISQLGTHSVTEFILKLASTCTDYLSLVRSQLENFAIVWRPTTVSITKNWKVFKRELLNGFYLKRVSVIRLSSISVSAILSTFFHCC